MPVASTEWTAIGQPSTGTAVMLSTGTAVVPSTGRAVVPSTGAVVMPSTAEVPLDSEDKTTMGLTYIVVYANKQILIKILNKYGWFKNFMTCARQIKIFSTHSDQ